MKRNLIKLLRHEQPGARRIAVVAQASDSRSRLPFFCVAAILIGLGQISAQDFEHEPIRYETSSPDNAVSSLQADLNEKRAHLHFDGSQGYLRSVLESLDVPVSSQTLVFSKTSLQRNRITPRTPRAIYFNDETYVGYCHQGENLEISTVEPHLGSVFYTLAQKPVESPEFRRQTDNCLSCHGTVNTRGVPGHLVRSVFSDSDGFPILSMGTHRIDHSSSIDKRWGGWYVTGNHGTMNHLGNLIVSSAQQRESIDNKAGQNVTCLDDRLDTSRYLTPHSDIVALMVLEHQVEGHNLLTRASFQTREALYAEKRLNKDLGEPEDHRWESTTTRIKSACECLTKYMLFCDEAPLTSKFKGTSQFAEQFSQRGPRDSQGRSLRDFDLDHRLFRFPCSYLIYSRSFDELPGEAKDYVLRRMWEVLSGADRSREFSHLSDADRTAILEILLATKPGLFDAWNGSVIRGEQAP